MLPCALPDRSDTLALGCVCDTINGSTWLVRLLFSLLALPPSLAFSRLGVFYRQDRIKGERETFPEPW